MKPPKLRTIVFSWLWAFLCALAIFFTVPLARKIQNLVSTLVGRSFFGYLVLFAAAATFLGAGYILYFRLKIRKLPNYLWLVFISAIYVYFTLKLWANPEEAVHFIQYGLLGFFLFRAFHHHIDDKGIYLAAFLGGTLTGTFDEILQWIVPGRYFDLRDVGLNALSSALFQILLWKGIRPKLLDDKIRPRSIRIVSVLLAANLLLLGLCLSNTPQRVKKYTKAIPFLSGLERQEAMSEFKFKHKDPEIGIFYSRLTLEELKNIDTYRGEEFGNTLREWQNQDYAEYLRIFPGSITPFLHEIRVHIFRRDKRLERAQSSFDESVQRENFFIAYKENLILEKYFGRTLAESPHSWDEAQKKEILKRIDPETQYKSPVSAGIWATVNERVTWIIIAAILIGLFIINLYIVRISKPLDRRRSI